MMKISFILVLSIFFFLFNPLCVKAASYYVATTGNDSNPGTQSQPFKTIQKGVNVANNPGDIILVFPGEYRPTAGSTMYPIVISGKHGAPGKNIVLKAFDKNNPPLLSGEHAVRILDSSYLTVDGFNMTDGYHSLISMAFDDHITISNNHLYLGFTGICDGTEIVPDPYAGCTPGWPKGRHNPLGNAIVESDNIVTAGVIACKVVDSQIVNNWFENTDEGVYLGTHGNVGISDCSIPGHVSDRVWTERNLIANNNIENPFEAIELKPDARNNQVQDNVIRYTRADVEIAAIEIRGHYNEIGGNIIVGGSKEGIKVGAEDADPGGDRVETYKYTRTDGTIAYTSSYKNNIHNNYLYYWDLFYPNEQASTGFIGIDARNTTAANTITHNTIVGYNSFPGKISQYASIKASSYPETIVKDNLMVGVRRATSDFLRYEYQLLASANLYPQVSDFNAYFPRYKTDGTSCVVTFGGLSKSIKCENKNPDNLGMGYEYNSRFLDSNPIRSSEEQCNIIQLLALPINQLKDRITYCSTPLSGSAILSSASDRTNIGAYQNQSSPIPTPTPTPGITGDLNHDGVVNIQDFILLSNDFNKTGTGLVSDLNNDQVVNIQDFILLSNNFGK